MAAAWMMSSLLKPAGGAALVLQLRRGVPTAPLALLLRIRLDQMATSTTQPQQHGGDGEKNGGGGGGVINNPPPGMAPLPEDAPRQTPPRLGEPDPVGPPVPTTSEDRIGGGGGGRSTEDGGAGGGPAGGMPDTAPPADVDLPPVSPDGSNV